MARLMRVHFSSIGHRDARLSPLTLDFRYGNTRTGGTGGGVDSLLLLRNGGGKSSIINLFYSVFRTHHREFLGSAAEGKARRIDDYIKATDLAFVITEWDTDPDGGPSLFPEPPAQVRLVGQVLAWKGQQRSADRSRLRRLFFSAKVSSGLLPSTAHHGETPSLSLDSWPVQGLGDPVASFDDFREWLRQATHTHPTAEVYATDHHRRWEQHLEDIGLDSQVFRYQLKMNKREGAADEAFRFASGREFVGFLLELAFGVSTADQLAKNIEAQRESLARRPGYELERRFLAAALSELRGLERAVRQEGQARLALDERVDHAAALRAAIDEEEVQNSARAQQVRTVADEARERERIARNDRDRLRRWRGGLERLACEYDYEAAQETLAEAKELRDGGQLEVQQLEAATALRRLNIARGKAHELSAALDRAQLDAAPLRAEAARHGGGLAELLKERSQQLDTRKVELEGLGKGAKKSAIAARAAGDEARRRQGELSAELRHLEARLNHREQARKRLIDKGLIDHREAAEDALGRWQARLDALHADLERSHAEHATGQETAAQVQQRRMELEGELSALAMKLEGVRASLERGRDWHERLASESLIVEVEGVDGPARLSASGLEERLRGEAEVARRRQLESRVGAADDERAKEAIDRDGLLPAPLEQARLIDALRADGINAHGGLAYLAENTDAEARPGLLMRRPSTFGGVVVVDDKDLAGAKLLSFSPPPRMPLLITQVATDDLAVEVRGHAVEMPSGNADGGLDQGCAHQGQPQGIPGIESSDQARHHLMLPDAASFDHLAAQSLRDRLHLEEAQRRAREQVWARREEQLRELAEDLSRYLEEYGAGEIERLAEHVDAVTGQQEGAHRERAELLEQAEALASQIAEIVRRMEELQTAALGAAQAREQLRAFIEEHERGLAETRHRRHAVEEERSAVLRALAEATEEENRELSRAAGLADRARELAHAVRDLDHEFNGIAYRPDPGARVKTRAGLTLEDARTAYEAARRLFEDELGAERLLGELDAARERIGEAERDFQKICGALEEASLQRLAAYADLHTRITQAKAVLPELIESVGKAAQRLERAEADLEDRRRRREAEDLPSVGERPQSAEAARIAAATYGRQAEEASARALEAEQRGRQAAEQADDLVRQAQHLKNLADNLMELVQAATGEPMPRRPPLALVSDLSIEERAKRAKGGVREAQAALDVAIGQARERAEQVQRVANDSSFSELRVQHRERLRDESAELCPAAPQLRAAFEERLATVDTYLDQFEKDRRVLVEELLQLTDQVETLLKRTNRASILPAELGAWSRRPYLRIRFNFPAGDEERRARLEPLIDRLVQRASLPSGLELVKEGADALAGQAGFRVDILKPDSVLRPEPVPISAMSSFSRGQQLTAAILLYCTLVQLRARSRGSARGALDAGVLILDNPIGTCSSVPLLQLQRRIAQQMRVQLIYATGVEDMEAAAVLPNTVRLRNEHREQRSGDHHISHAEELSASEGVLESVRVLEVGGG